MTDTFLAALVLATAKVRQGDGEERSRVGTEAMDFMEGMRDGWNGLMPPVAANRVSFNIIIKVWAVVAGEFEVGRLDVSTRETKELTGPLKAVQGLSRPTWRTYAAVWAIAFLARALLLVK